MGPNRDATPQPPPEKYGWRPSFRCPVCDSDDWLRAFERPPDFALGVCAGCGLAGNLLMRSADEQRAYYETDYRGKPVGRRYLLGELAHALEVLHWLGDGVRPGARHLDLGCAAGGLLAVTRRRGCQVTGIEIDRHYSAFARETLGLTVHGVPHDLAPLEPGAFDLLTCAHVLEHIVDPVAFLAAAAPLAAPGAVLYLEVPNLDAPWHWKTPRRFYGPHHNWYFTAASLASAAARAGWRPVLQTTSRRDHALVLLAEVGAAEWSREDPADVLRRARLLATAREPVLVWWRRKLLRAAQKRAAEREYCELGRPRADDPS